MPMIKTYGLIVGALISLPKGFTRCTLSTFRCPYFLPGSGNQNALPKIKMFFWLLANDRLNTKDMLMRRSFNLNDNGLCRMCNNGLIETRDHL
jgi:hypothetical protein